MCFVSLVMDEWKPYVPNPNKTWPGTAVEPLTVPIPTPTPSVKLDLSELRALLDAFKKAVEAAAAFDKLTGQPDCVDPEKAKLEERVAELEKKLDALGVQA